MRQKLKMPLIAVCLCLTGAGTANAQWVVSDPGNLAQSIIKLNPHARLHVVQTNLTAHWEPP